MFKAYSKGITKEDFVRETKLHRERDHFLKGTYGERDTYEGQACAVGCAIKSLMKLTGEQLCTSNHSLLEEYAISPEWLARVEDLFFENLPEERSKNWPVEFAEAINEGADLNKIKIPFRVFILQSNIEQQEKLLKTITNESIREVIKGSINVNKQMIKAQEAQKEVFIVGIEGELAEKLAAQSAAESAAWSAESAAWSAWSAEAAAGLAAESAAWSAESAAWLAAESAAVRLAAESAARLAAESAESAAWSAWSEESAAGLAAESAAWSAESAAWSAAWSAAYEKYADKLLELIKECHHQSTMRQHEN